MVFQLFMFSFFFSMIFTSLFMTFFFSFVMILYTFFMTFFFFSLFQIHFTNRARSFLFIGLSFFTIHGALKFGIYSHFRIVLSG